MSPLAVVLVFLLVVGLFCYGGSLYEDSARQMDWGETPPVGGP